MKWRACSQGKTYDTGDGFIVYFDPASGNTHLISDVAAYLLAELTIGPLSTEQIQVCLAAKGVSASAADETNHISAMIQELQSFDLIEPI